MKYVMELFSSLSFVGVSAEVEQQCTLVLPVPDSLVIVVPQ